MRASILHGAGDARIERIPDAGCAGWPNAMSAVARAKKLFSKRHP
jgi:hypothetical protein